jgi:hypothetical protein
MKFIKCPIKTCAAKIVVRSDINQTFEAMQHHLKTHSFEDLEYCFLCFLMEYLKKEVKE